MSCFNSNKTIHDCDAGTVLLNVYICVVCVGKAYSALVPSHLPHQTRLDLLESDSACDEDLEEIVAALPELVVIHNCGAIVVAVKKRATNNSNSCDADDEWSDTDE